MPLKISVHHQPDHLHIRYSGRVTALDIKTLVSGMEDGDFPPTFNLLHDFENAETFDFPDNDAVRLSFRRRATIPQDLDHVVHAAVVGANSQVLKSLTVWLNLFYPDKDHYQMRVCADHNSAREWIRN